MGNKIQKIFIGTNQVRPSIIKSAWIYHNPSEWLLSISSDGTNWITIADKNLWATQVWNSWDTLSEVNCGKYYQWGNNYWFAWKGSVTSSTTRVNASTYWPWNYYNWSTFIKWRNAPYDRSSVRNNNLRWWETWTNEAMQWPCASGFHVPRNTERQAVKTVWTALGGWSSAWTNFGIYLKLPFAGKRDNYYADIASQGSAGIYRSSISSTASSASSSYANAFYLNFSSSSISPQGQYWERANWLSVRPFKNEAVQPDTSRTKLY